MFHLFSKSIVSILCVPCHLPLETDSFKGITGKTPALPTLFRIKGILFYLWWICYALGSNTVSWFATLSNQIHAKLKQTAAPYPQLLTTLLNLKKELITYKKNCKIWYIYLQSVWFSYSFRLWILAVKNWI